MPRQVGETPAFAVGYGAARVGAARDGGAGREHRENNWHGLHGLHCEEEYRIQETAGNSRQRSEVGNQ